MYIICSVWWQVLEFGVLIFVCGVSGANTDSVRNWSLHFLQRAGVLGHSGRPLVRGSGLMAEYLSFNDSVLVGQCGKGAAKGNPVISRHHSAYKLPNEIILSMQRLVSNRGDGSLADHPLLLGDLTSDSERPTCTSRYLCVRSATPWPKSHSSAWFYLSIQGVLLRDRDLILAQSIRRTCGTLSNPGAVVAVLGAAHCNGVKRHLLTPEEVPSAWLPFQTRSDLVWSWPCRFES